MLGDILGRRAGLTSTELVLFLFLTSRPKGLDSARLLDVRIRGDAKGLGNTELLALRGALEGPNLGVFLADKVGVVSFPFAPTVLIGVKRGFEVGFAGSGKAISSIICSISASEMEACSFRLDARCGPPIYLPACFRIFINDAGVAGSLSMASMGADWEPACFAARYGDLPADVDLGVAGGGINISDKGSGDTESASELFWL